MTKNAVVTAMDSARRFWGDSQVKKAQFTERASNANGESDICMLSESFATDGGMMIYGAADKLEFKPVENSRYSGMSDEAKIKSVILPYVNAALAVDVPENLWGHLSAEYGHSFQIAAAGRWCAFVANDAEHGMHVTDGADMGDFFNLGGIKASFSAATVAKIFKRFVVKSVEVRRPSVGVDIMRFEVVFKGAKFIINLLKNSSEYSGDFEDEAKELVEKWDREDVKRAQEERNATEIAAAVATYPAAPVAACRAPRTEDKDAPGYRIEENAEKGGIEVYFDKKPAVEVRDALKNAGFRWHGAKLCWYSKKMGVEEARALVMGENRTETAQEGGNARGGAEVRPEPEMAPEAKETAKAESVPEPVEGRRDFVRDIRKGDVVRISGVTGSTGKSINGHYYVETVHGAGDYWLNSLKRDRGSDFEGIGKKTHSWPLHCYANNPKVRAEFRENIKDAKIEGMGPRSAAVYSLMLRNLDELRANMGGYAWAGGECYRQEQQKRADDLAADLRRMREENPGLDQFAAKLDEKFKPTGPGLAIRADGLEVRSDCGTWDKYSLSMSHKGDAVIIWGSYYGRSSSATIPAGFGFDVTNNSDPYTDYHEPDGATVKQDHPLFNTLVRIIDAGRGRYELTDADAEAIAAHLKAKEAAAEAAREAERAEYVEKCRKMDEYARSIIEEAVELFPGDRFHPYVVIEWSELGAFDGMEAEDLGSAAPVFSIDAFEMITGDIDRYFRKNETGYYKLKFMYHDGSVEFSDRCDLGDGGGSYGNRMRYALEHAREHASNDGRIMLDGGATVPVEEYEINARRYLESVPVTFDEVENGLEELGEAV